jgi:hypothetical protein
MHVKHLILVISTDNFTKPIWSSSKNSVKVIIYEIILEQNIRKK